MTAGNIIATSEAPIFELIADEPEQFVHAATVRLEDRWHAVTDELTVCGRLRATLGSSRGKATYRAMLAAVSCPDCRRGLAAARTN